MIHLHPVLLIFTFISLITGTFSQLFIMLSIVFIHEMGHYFAATIFKWKIEKIIFWVFGGVMITSEYGSRKIKEDIIVTVAGPLQHGMIYFILYVLSSYQMIPLSMVEMAMFYNLIILLFNLLPIFPLDGGKLLFYILSAYIPYRKAHQFIILFSLKCCIAIIVFQLFFLPFTLSAVLLIAFLFLENRLEWKNQYYIFLRFLLNRFHEGNTHYFKQKKLFVDPTDKLIHIFSQFRRNRVHKIYVNHFDTVHQLSEKNSLYLFFEKNKLNETIAEIVEEKDLLN